MGIDLPEHDPEKWRPVFREDHAQTRKMERDDFSKKSRPALAGANAQTFPVGFHFDGRQHLRIL
jgi:hypothetical protein